MSRKTNRRKILSGLSVGVATALAGCSGIFGDENNDGTDTQQPFEYPEGFSEEGIEDFAQALGEESAHYQADSFSFTSNYEFEQPNGTQELSAESQVSGADEQQYYRSENSQSVQEQYHDVDTVYLRLYNKRRDQSRYQTQEAPFNKEGAYLLTLFQNQLQGIDYSMDEVVEDGSQVRYTADIEAVPEGHYMYEQYNNLTAFDVQFTVDTDGYVRTVSIDLTREVQTQSGGQGTDTGTSTPQTSEVNESYQFEFSDHNETTVEEPDWTAEAEEASQSTPPAPTPTPSGTDSTPTDTTNDTTTDTPSGTDAPESMPQFGF